ncbi:MAG: hypothetical protein C4323_12195 [Mastigocladus sp. ERB_26_2]
MLSRVCYEFSLTHPCILKEVVNRHTLGYIRPLCSMDYYNNLFDRTRTVAGGKTLFFYLVCSLLPHAVD